MTGRKPGGVNVRLLAAAGGLVILAAVWSCYLLGPSQTVPKDPLPSAPNRLPTKTDQPIVEISPEGNLERVIHRSPRGLLPLEFVETKDGTVRIQRTFDGSGRLLREEAFMGDRKVPLPKKGSGRAGG